MVGKRLTNKQRFWLNHLESWSRTSEPLSEYAKRNGLRLQTLYVAKRRLQTRGLWTSDTAGSRHGRFVRVEVPEGTATEKPCQVHLPNGARVEVPVSDDALEAVLRTVASL